MLRTTSGMQYSGGGLGLKSSGIFAQSATPASVTGTTVETALATISIPGGTVAQHGRVRVKTLWSMTSSTNGKTPRVRIGGLAGTELANGNVTTAVGFEALGADFMNAGGGNIIYFQDWLAGGNVSGIGGTGGTTARDMSLTQNLVISGQLGVPGETLTLLGYSIEILNP